VPEWNEVGAPNNGIFFRTLSLSNHGDAPARDIRIEVQYVDGVPGKPWQHETVIEPGAVCTVVVPIVDAVSRSKTGYGEILLERKADPSTYKFVRPTVTVYWRQAPLDRNFHERILAPRSPDPFSADAQ
jgi:hypothetical protein